MRCTDAAVRLSTQLRTLNADNPASRNLEKICDAYIFAVQALFTVALDESQPQAAQSALDALGVLGELQDL